MTREEHKKAIIENLNAMVDKLEDDTEYFDALYHLDMLCKEAEPCEDCIKIPKGATNGDMIKALYPEECASWLERNCTKWWWNSTYRKEQE